MSAEIIIQQLIKKPFKGKTIKNISFELDETKFDFTDGTTITIVIGPNGFGKPEMFLKTGKLTR